MRKIMLLSSGLVGCFFGSVALGLTAPVRELTPPKTLGAVELTAISTLQNAPAVAWTQQVVGSRQLHAAQLVDVQSGSEQSGSEQSGSEQWKNLADILNEDAAFNVAQLRSRIDSMGNFWLGWAEDAGEAHVDSWIMSMWDCSKDVTCTWSNPSHYAVRRNLSDAGRSRGFDILPTGIPALAWTDIYAPHAYSDAIRTLAWNGKTWLPEPILSDIKQAGFAPEIRVNKLGGRTVTFLEGDFATMNVVVKREIQPQQWQPLGAGLNRFSNTYAAAPKMILRPDGRPIVGWIEADPNGGPDHVYVSRWTGSAWQPLGGSVSASSVDAGNAEALCVALTAKGGARVAWLQNGQLHAATWTGQKWTAIPLPTTKQATGPSISEDGRWLSVSDNGHLRIWALQP